MDPWLNSPDRPADNGYEIFLSNMQRWALQDYVVAVRLPSLQAAKELPVNPSLIYIDASHEVDLVYADLCAWAYAAEIGLRPSPG